MNKKFITLHIVNDLPWSNLNRDDTGAPKRTILGGVERGMLSSQSLKRAARKDYETRILKVTPADLDESYRSRNLPEFVAERAKKIIENSGEIANEKKLLAQASKVIKALTGKADAKNATMTWMSLEEIETLAAILADGFSADEIEKLASAKNASAAFEKFMNERGATGSLAIAAFGRMFANATRYQTEAAIAVSPAVSTHGSLIETDYFITADDYIQYDEENGGGAGAGHLGVALYTSGVFYRTVTIDIEELWSNWTGRDSAFAKAQLNQFVTSLIRSLPTGKKNSTNPYGDPLLIIAEEQSYRSAYSISAPILNPDESGYKGKTINSLRKQFDLAREISPDVYGNSIISGTEAKRFGSEVASIPRVVDQIITWLEELNPKNQIDVTEEKDTEAETPKVLNVFELAEESNIAEDN